MPILQIPAINEIYFPASEHSKVIEHCLRKLNGDYFSGETEEKQAYGLVGGKFQDSTLLIGLVIPLNNNDRISGIAKEYMDDRVRKYAIPGGLPVSERAWSADPFEVKNAMNVFQRQGLQLIGTYHMHHVNSWQGNEPRDMPTNLDQILGTDTGLITFITAIIEPSSYGIRAFYEGSCEQEIKVLIN